MSCLRKNQRVRLPLLFNWHPREPSSCSARAHEPRQYAFGRAQASRRGMAASHAALDTRTAFHPNVARSHFEGRVVPGLFHRNLEFRNTRAYARASLKSHRRWLAHCDSRRDRAANRLDHVTLTPGAAALAVATDTLWVPFGHKATSPHSTGWAACAGRRCHAKAAVRPIS